MRTLKAIQLQTNELTARLGEIQSELTAKREALTRSVAIFQKDNRAESQENIAARIMVLEAQDKATREAIERNNAEAGRVEDLLKSKEYKEAQKRMTELEKFFQVEADEVHNIFFLLHDRLKEVNAKYGEFRKLDSIYGNGNEYRYQNKDFGYLLSIYNLVAGRLEIERRAKAADTPAKIFTGPVLTQ